MNTSVWQRLQRLVHELGAFTALLYMLDRLLRRVSLHSGFYYYRFLAQPLRGQPRLPPTRGSAFTFRLLQAPDPVLDTLDRPASEIAQRFAQGAQCLVATKNGVLEGCIWFIHHVYREDEVDADYWLPPGASCVWDFDVFVAPSQRLGFLFAKQWDVFDALLRPQGVHHTLSRINAFNQRSVASHRSLGAQDCGWALFLRLGSLQAMLSSQQPFMAWGGRPALHLGPGHHATGEINAVAQDGAGPA